MYKEVIILYPTYKLAMYIVDKPGPIASFPASRVSGSKSIIFLPFFVSTT